MWSVWLATLNRNTFHLQVKKSPFSLASNLFALVTVLCLGFSCAIIEKKNISASAVSSPYPLLFPVARTAPLYCRQVLMVSRRDSALHCRLHSCIISPLRSTVIHSQLQESWEFGISYLFSKSLSRLWRDVKKGIKIKRKGFIFFFLLMLLRLPVNITWAAASKFLQECVDGASK